jgi:carbamate kinase
MAERLIIALGGNAFATPDEPLTMAGQFRFAKELAQQLAPLFRGNRQIVMTHGNGPQVGQMLVRVEEALGKAYAVPLEVCVAESEGELGYVLQQSLYNVLRESGGAPRIAGVLTQVLVSADDPAFAVPTKPVGQFYSAEQAERLRERGFHVCEDAGRGYRRMVPSPRPLRIVESDVIDALLNLGVIVIGAGGGGIPVVERDGKLGGIEAVVDKDLASAVLGAALDARELLILTGVPCAYRDFGTAQQKPLRRLTVAEAGQLVEEGHFTPGSMQPKIEAASQFAQRPGCRAMICDPASAIAAMAGAAGTIIMD